MCSRYLCASLFLLLIGIVITGKYTPIVLWHGLGDSSNSYGVNYILDDIYESFPGIYIRTLLVVNSSIMDRIFGAYISPMSQVEAAIDIIKNDANLQDGYIGIGLSQGGLFLRVVAQKCSNPPAKMLITLGAPHLGVFGLKKICNPSHLHLCLNITKRFSNFMYNKWAQSFYTPAGYWHDPFQNEEYLRSCEFLPKVNHEIEIINKEKNNLMKLEKLVLVKFKDDTILTPAESAWFGFYKLNSTTILPFNKTDLYKKNILGLKDMVEKGIVDFIELPGNHLEFDSTWLIDDILKGYLVKHYKITKIDD